MRFDCQECGENVSANERHTFEDCKIYKEKLRMVELSRLQSKFASGATR